jgi:hypothetical protein
MIVTHIDCKTNSLLAAAPVTVEVVTADGAHRQVAVTVDTGAWTGKWLRPVRRRRAIFRKPTSAFQEDARRSRGFRTYVDEDWRSWREAEWDAWHAATPSEFDVILLAGCWSVDPSRVDAPETGTAGIFRMPDPAVEY